MLSSGGESGIRTHGTLAGTPDFESGTFGHSDISPRRNLAAKIGRVNGDRADQRRFEAFSPRLWSHGAKGSRALAGRREAGFHTGERRSRLAGRRGALPGPLACCREGCDPR